MTQLEVELLLVADCPHEAAAIDLIRHALDDVGLLGAPFKTRTVTSQQQADELGFTGSPTILSNGIDPFAQPRLPPSLACSPLPNPGRTSGHPEPAGSPSRAPARDRPRPRIDGRRRRVCLRDPA
jgi:hypothetical protein